MFCLLCQMKCRFTNCTSSLFFVWNVKNTFHKPLNSGLWCFKDGSSSVHRLEKSGRAVEWDLGLCPSGDVGAAPRRSDVDRLPRDLLNSQLVWWRWTTAFCICRINDDAPANGGGAEDVCRSVASLLEPPKAPAAASHSALWLVSVQFTTLDLMSLNYLPSPSAQLMLRRRDQSRNLLGLDERSSLLLFAWKVCSLFLETVCVTMQSVKCGTGNRLAE